MTTTTETPTIRQQVDTLVELVLAGKAMDAFERFYGDDVEMQENNNAPTVGKAANREREEKFFGSLEGFHGATAPLVAVEGNQAVINWRFDVTFKGGGRTMLDQLSVQTWHDDEIVAEKFYYDTAS